ncbi:MAG: XRE family transcriptional regulator [Mesorhizobium sp.]|uniref:helix-turn-helix domain-containing protein n=1 Tax=Mesorhizobium sp. TaxID=1871066 RepID=UPI000FE8871C|nr:helix-turn-helix transcriptional regulator [Mesorhizobium sp.]RWE05802.1 MAG: XRE family transcriptional regulator [Mesorhizobium sp.]
MVKNAIPYEERAGLVETTDLEIDKPIFRHPGFAGIDQLGKMDERISDFLLKARRDVGLTREELARFLGLSTQVFGRYEKAISKLHVTRLVHLSEILGFHPMDLVYSAAPHLFGKTAEEAADQIKLAKLIWTLPPRTISTLVDLVEEMHAISASGEPPTEKPTPDRPQKRGRESRNEALAINR